MQQVISNFHVLFLVRKWVKRPTSARPVCHVPTLGWRAFSHKHHQLEQNESGSHQQLSRYSATVSHTVSLPNHSSRAREKSMLCVLSTEGYGGYRKKHILPDWKSEACHARTSAGKTRHARQQYHVLTMWLWSVFILMAEPNNRYSSMHPELSPTDLFTHSIHVNFKPPAAHTRPGLLGRERRKAGRATLVHQRKHMLHTVYSYTAYHDTETLCYLICGYECNSKH